ncbi:MAG TPA: aldehyde dehydrogenase family protein [Methylococcales bacterium]|nr:aldehyde dehydrogenase family protein [Methylococcales bacterium]
MMDQALENINNEIAELVSNASISQQSIAHFNQQETDALVTAIAWSVVRQDHAEELAQLAVDEGGFGNYADKVTKIRNRIIGTLTECLNVKTVGIIEEDSDRGLLKIAKPVGVVAALIPTTGPDATPPLKTILAIKGRNAIIIAAHPRTQKTTELAVQYMRNACEQFGVSSNLIQIIQSPSLKKTSELMRQADLIIATGGEGMVKAAYSSGTPAYGVGVGNSVHVIDETADLNDAAIAIATAKKFDYATSCLADNAVVIESGSYRIMIETLINKGGHLCNSAEKQRLQEVMWPNPNSKIPSLDVIAKSAQHIAGLAGIDVAPECSFLMVEEQGTGADHPFSGEKLSVVLAVYQYQGAIDNAIDIVNKIIDYQGHGHTCGIHSQNDQHVMALANNTKTGRVMVNQNLNEGAGSPRNGLPYTLSLSCGSWGGNITTENINARHFINITWVSRPLVHRRFDIEALFEKHWQRFGQ